MSSTGITLHCWQVQGRGGVPGLGLGEVSYSPISHCSVLQFLCQCWNRWAWWFLCQFVGSVLHVVMFFVLMLSSIPCALVLGSILCALVLGFMLYVLMVV